VKIKEVKMKTIFKKSKDAFVLPYRGLEVKCLLESNNFVA
jgi:hypothetical protein